MPDTTITITHEQRNGLYEPVRNYIAGIDDVWIALEQTKEFAVAERLGQEFCEDIRLLQDSAGSRATTVTRFPDHADVSLIMRPMTSGLGLEAGPEESPMTGQGLW